MLAVKGKTLELRKTRELDAGHTKTGEHYLGPGGEQLGGACERPCIRNPGTQCGAESYEKVVRHCLDNKRLGCRV